jgi:hypothetical protein
MNNKTIIAICLFLMACIVVQLNAKPTENSYEILKRLLFDNDDNQMMSLRHYKGPKIGTGPRKGCSKNYGDVCTSVSQCCFGACSIICTNYP